MQTGPVQTYIGVASNIEPEAHILRVLELLPSSVRVTGTSTFYRTPAINRPEQPPYLDGVWRVETAVAPRTLKFEILRPIESQLGRVRSADKYAARTIDLDVLLYGSQVLTDEDCRVPAPEIRTRAFLIAGLLELAPGLVLPDTGEPLASLLRAAEVAACEPQPAFTQKVRALIRRTAESGVEKRKGA